MVANAELFMDQVSNTTAGPDRAAKAEGFRSLGQQGDEESALLGRE
jgi:hypothetical protein